METLYVKDKVRLYKYPDGDINSHATIKYIYSNGEAWLLNKDYPVPGTIDKIVTKETLIELITPK